MRYDCWKQPRGSSGRLLSSVKMFRLFDEDEGRVAWDAFHWHLSGDTLAEAVAKEHAVTCAIQADPFTHIPAYCRGGRWQWGKDWLNMGKGQCWRSKKTAAGHVPVAHGAIRFGATPSEKRRAAAAKAVATRRARLGMGAPAPLSPRAIPSEARHLAAVKAAETRRRNAATGAR